VMEANRPELSLWAMVIGITSSAVVGIVAGLYPAIRASLLSPVEALRTD
jgi:putative ABC transport system permease protein